MSSLSYKDNPGETSTYGEDAFPPTASVFRSNDDNASTATSRRRKICCCLPRPKSRRGVWMLRAVFAFGLLLMAVIGVAVYLGMQNSSSTPRNVGPLISSEEMDRYLRQAVGANELENRDSYTSLAYRWMLQNPFSLQEFRMRVEDRVLQRYALACLYYATYRVNNDWLRYNQGLLDAQPQDIFAWTESQGWLVYANECDWYGITCNQFGYVTSLDLGSNELTGEIPPQLQYLSHGLEFLNIEGNYAYNVHPHFLGKLTNLKYLYMKSSLFESDGIPLVFAALTNLEEFDCSHTMFHGPLREDIFENMAQLRYLEISGNQVNGTLPQSLISLPNLKYFYADSVGLTGNLEFLQDMSALVETWLDRNPTLTGTLPTVLGPQLESLSLTRNNITSSIPNEWGSHSKLKHLWLYSNYLYGSIPHSFRKLSQLQTFAIEDNLFTGNVEHMCTDLSISEFQVDCEMDCSCCSCCGLECTGERD
ncbi:hypothetical protein FisN_7Lh057 [Fistulifera solaris]|uniref:Leucine-rich repeat-containing N-terminal plant-type domain-containing protein n=1 Tax=Fistulifera solaris TaxID=1519565 RepID=A0A1Z5JCH9_FISSO|nr:hypothetical protein FisN_7Lh057 [Fistulifera solaris]|eukprot:GAX11689.1 hypothetical protein FisN_7Lh057 [Fistulifera solaris]